MSATATGVLELDFISGTQVNADVAFNTLAIKLEAQARGVMLNASLSTPPGSESDGDVYFCSGSGSGGWANFTNELVIYHQSSWYSLGTPEEGATWYDVNNAGLYAYESSAWAAVGGGGGSTNSFETINCPNGTDPVADSSTDTLNLTDGDGITITGTAGTDTISIAAGPAWGTITCDTSTVVPANYDDGLSMVGSGGIATNGNGAQAMIISFDADNATINADDVTNNSDVSGTNVDDALNNLGNCLVVPATASTASSIIMPPMFSPSTSFIATSNDEVYAMYLGQATKDFVIDHIKVDARSAGSGSSTSQVGVYTSSGAPAGSAQDLTRVGTAQGIGLTSSGINSNSFDINASISSGDHVWLVIRIDLTTSQPQLYSTGGSFESGHAQTKTGESTLGASITGMSLAGAARTTEVPYMVAELGS